MLQNTIIKLFDLKFTIFLLFFTVQLFAQFPNLKFENLDTTEGLSSSTCLEIFQDSEGFMWFGTIDGLNRYDGYDFEIYRPVLNDSTSISNNRINSVVEDHNGNLWIGTSNGLNVFDKKQEKFHKVPLHHQSSKLVDQGEIINDVLFDENSGFVWVATKNGVVRVEVKNNTKAYYKNLKVQHYNYQPDSEMSIDNNDVTAIVKDAEGRIWVVTEGHYLNAYNAESDVFERVLIDIPNSYELNHIPKSILVDTDGDFWIGNNLSTLVFWDRSESEFRQISPVQANTPIFHMFQGSNGLISIATDGDGIYVLEKGGGVLQHIVHSNSNPFSLPNNQPSKILEDNQGIYWIGTYNKGVSKLVLSKSDFGHYFYQQNRENGLSAKIAQSVLQDSKGNIWIGTDGGGLNLFSEKDNTFKHFKANPNNRHTLSSDKIVYLLESFDHSIWVCTWDGGLNKFNPETGKVKQFKYEPNNPFSIGQNTVWCAAEDNKRRLWLGTQTEGLNLYDYKTNKFFKFKTNQNSNDGLVSNLVFSMFIDSKNRLLLGTSLGVSIVDLEKLDGYIPKEIKFLVLKEEKIQGTRVNYITEDNNGDIWLGTDIAMHHLNPDLKLIKSYSTQNGLPNNLILGIVQSNEGNLWITTKGGLSKLDVAQNRFYNYTVQDGVQGVEFQSKSIDKLNDGRIIAGGINGFNLFDPSNIVEKPALMHPIITKFKLFNEEVKPGDKVNNKTILNESISSTNLIDLKHDQGFLSFEFVAFNYENQKRVKYVYRMKGLHEDYISAGANRVANYSSIPAGDYEFEVKASLNGDWENAESTSIKIHVATPPWKTWWAYLLYALILLSIIWLGIYYYTRILKEEKEHELDQMKLKFFVNVSHELRTPLTLILNPVDKILESFNNPEVVKSSALTLQRSARRLLYLVNQLLDFRKMDLRKSPLKLMKGDYVQFSEEIFSLFNDLAKSKKIRYKFKSNEDEIMALFDFDKVEKIIVNLLSNAVKFTGEKGKIELSISKAPVVNRGKLATMYKAYGNIDCVKMKIRDTGIGFKPEQLKNVFGRFVDTGDSKVGMGIGLNITKGLVNLHGGDIFIKSKYGKGTTFTVFLPITTNISDNQVIVESDKDKIIDYDINALRSAEYEQSILKEVEQESSQTNAETEKVNKTTILIVEDNRELRKHLKAELEGMYNVKEATNGIDGLDKISKYYPDLVISDIMMPKMDGYELCKRVKENLDTCHIPVILLTAKGLNEDKIEGFNIGADDYIPKPYNVHILKARVKNLLEAKKRLRDKFSAMGGIVPSSEVTSNSLDEAFLDKTTKIILENVSDMDFKLDDLLQEIGIGRSQFYRKINSLTNQNPSQFIRTVRLRYAADLLLKNQYSIKEVAYMSGFNSTAYFSKTFRELFELTPTQYLEKNRNSQ